LIVLNFFPMSRIKLLQSNEIKEFDSPVVLTVTQQNHFFEISEIVALELKKLRHPCSKIGYLLQLGYFKFHGRFFEITNFKEEDLLYIADKLKLNLRNFDFFSYYNKQIAYDHRERILLITRWKSFDNDLFKHQIERLVENHLMPRKVLWETKEYLFRQGFEAPAYDKYMRCIQESLSNLSKRTNQSLEKYLSPVSKAVLDEFMTNKAAFQVLDIQEYKVINQSSQPNDIKKSIEQFKILMSRFNKLKSLIDKMNFSDATIDYHANWVLIADNDKIESNSDKYLFLLCFLIRQIRIRQDFFIDILQLSVKSAENQAKRIQKEEYFQTQKNRLEAIRLLKNSQKSYKAKVDDISAIVCSDLDNNQKIREIEYVLEQDNLLSQEQLELLQTLENEVYRDEALAFYETWQKRSIWLNNRVGQIVCNLVVNKPNSDKLLAEAIEHYKINKGKISKPPLKITWLTDKQQQALWETNEKGKEVFQRSLYKMFLFEAVHDGIKSGKLNFTNSYRYRSLEEYLINKKDWESNKEQILTDAEMTHLLDYKENMYQIEEDLNLLFHQVNDNYNLGLNTYLKFDKSNKVIIDTPAVEKPDLNKISSLFKPARFISILDLLADVEKAAPFLNHFGHQSKKHERKRPNAETFFASIIALGCNIGVEKMGPISKGIQSATLQNTHDWYLSLQALKYANNAIIKVKNELDLPEIHRNSQDELHTASDGQKILNKKKTLNAAFSYKYPGFDKASVANTAVDERFALFYSTVVVASAREAVSMVDMHLGNPVVKSTIHSTDTHGSTEIVFGMMHMLGIYFAPRIKDIGNQQLYGLKTKREYLEFEYQLLPDHSINTAIIEQQWDDILRVIASLKLGKTTAEQVLKRLNSFTLQNPLQRAMKEFGKIIRTSFILKYYDDLDLRQSIEKMLSHIELMNRFAKAVFFSNNQEFQVATKEEQEKIIQCRVLLQNAIVLWNYLYLSDLLSKTQSQAEIEEILDIVRNSTAVVWHHVNMMGEYDFTKLLNNKIRKFDILKLMAWKYDKKVA
jgi:TnpA family transposase